MYQGQALVTREVSVPEGDGTVELVVTPLPAQTVDSSLYTEGADGLRVLSTRFRSRAVKDDTRQEVRAKEELLKELQTDAQRLQKEIAVQEEDLRYLQKLEGFTGTALTGLTAKGRLDSALFGEAQSRVAISVEPADRPALFELAKNFGLPLLPLGQTGGQHLRLGPDLSWPLRELRERYESGLPAALAYQE